MKCSTNTHADFYKFLVSYRFPPTLGAAFCWTLEALALGGALALAGALAFFVAFCDFFCSFAALREIKHVTNSSL